MMPADQAHAIVLIRALRNAAARLCDHWEGLDPDDMLNQMLTVHYPSKALALSFDEVVAEIGEWAEQMTECQGNTLTNLYGPPTGQAIVWRHSPELWQYRLNDGRVGAANSQGEAIKARHYYNNIVGH